MKKLPFCMNPAAPMACVLPSNPNCRFAKLSAAIGTVPPLSIPIFIIDAIVA